MFTFISQDRYNSRTYALAPYIPQGKGDLFLFPPLSSIHKRTRSPLVSVLIRICGISSSWAVRWATLASSSTV